MSWQAIRLEREQAIKLDGWKAALVLSFEL
jgi:hypothetical protein